MKIVMVTQRVDIYHRGEERRDGVDQKLLKIIGEAGFLPVTVPNNPSLAWPLIESLQPAGFVLSGGNSLVKYGGDAPERDALEQNIVQHAIKTHIPLLGICRGMQILLDYFGQNLQPVQGEVQPKQTITWRDKNHRVNSYHTWGCYTAPKALRVTGWNSEHLLKAIEHETHPLFGIMWHPERIQPFRNSDIELIKEIFA